jgi:arabinofuranan 3-O-arabinosyltransferase
VPVVRARAADRRTVVSGSGDGLVDAAGAGLVDGTRTVLYAGSAADPAELRRLAEGAELVVTDTNRARARQWRGSQDTVGFTEDGGPARLGTDPADRRLDPFPDAGPASQTLTEQRGPVRAVASAYGSPVAYWPEQRAARALDGDVRTAWRVGDRGPGIGERIRLELRDPTALTDITLVQAQPAGNRRITEVAITTDAGERVVALDGTSLTPAGQTVPLPEGTTSVVELEITGTDPGAQPDYFGIDGVGFAEIDLGGLAADGVLVDEVVLVPTDLLSATGAASLDAPLGIVLTRQRVDARKRWRDDDERSLVRELTVPVTRTYRLAGDVRLSPRAGDAAVDALVSPDLPAAVANTRLAGVPEARGRAAIDADPSTAWQTAFGTTTGAALTVSTGAPITVDRMDLQVLADARHSVPTELTLEAGGATRVVPLPALPDGRPGDPPVAVPVTFPSLTGDTVTVTVTGARDVDTVDRRTGELVTLPVGIAELGLPGVVAPPVPAVLDTGCRDDLLTLDGAPVPVRAQGDTAGALAGAPMQLTWCGDGDGPVLEQGTRLLRSALGVDAGLDIDRLVLRSAPGGSAAAAEVPSGGQGSADADPVVRVVAEGRDHLRAEVTAASGPFWFSSGQGFNDGWRIDVEGGTAGPLTLVDGGFSGWLVTPDAAGTPVTVTLRWTPQRFVWAGLVVSALTVAACVVLVAVTWRRRWRGSATDAVVLPATPWHPDEAPASAGRVVAGGALAAVLTGFVWSPSWAVVVGLLAASALRWPRARVALFVGSVGSLALAAVRYVVRQVAEEPQEGFGWVTRFAFGHGLALLAVVLLAADGIVGWLRRPAPRPAPGPAPDDVAAVALPEPASGEGDP